MTIKSELGRNEKKKRKAMLPMNSVLFESEKAKAEIALSWHKKGILLIHY